MAESTTPPRKTAAAKKTSPAKTAAAKAAAKPAKMNPYLPSLPKGWTYTGVTVEGPDGALMAVKVVNGKAALTIAAGDLHKSIDHDDVHAATAALGDAAKTITKIAEREAELALMRTEGLANLGGLGEAPATGKSTPTA